MHQTSTHLLVTLRRLTSDEQEPAGTEKESRTAHISLLVSRQDGMPVGGSVLLSLAWRSQPWPPTNAMDQRPSSSCVLHMTAPAGLPEVGFQRLEGLLAEEQVQQLRALQQREGSSREQQASTVRHAAVGAATAHGKASGPPAASWQQCNAGVHRKQPQKALRQRANSDANWNKNSALYSPAAGRTMRS